MSDVLLKLLAEKSRVIPRVGRYVGFDSGQALVDLGNERFPAAFTGGFVPQINDAVHVWSVDGVMFLIGPTVAKPGVGTVLTVSGSNANVSTDFGTFSMPFMGATPTSGDTVGISWSTSPWCGKLSSTPVTPVPPPDPGGGGSTVRTETFRAVDAGSTDRGSARWWQAQPWASNTTFGAWFYGTQIKDTIPAGATFVSLEMYASWQQRSGGAPRFALHNLFTKSGLPTFGAYTEWAPGAGWQTPPMAAAWFAALKAGGASAGVGLNQGGFNKFSSLAQDGLSGALRISWKG